MAGIELIQALAATAELCGTTLSEPAAKLLLADLAEFDQRAVLAALSKCRRELKGRLTLAEIVSRIDDGRPGVEEAWAMLPRDEDATVVWTDEMREASSSVNHLLEDGEVIAARMAFREVYAKLLAEAREARRPVNWTVSLGHSVAGRRTELLKAVAARRITAAHACALIPNFEVDGTATPLLKGKKVGVIGPTHAMQHYQERPND